MQHLIRKQIIQLGLSKETNAFGIQQLISNHYQQDVLPLLEQVFDKLSNEEETILIDHLEIDMGNISEKDIRQNKWDQKFLSKIKEQLYSKINKQSKNKKISRETRSLSICKQWLFYMEKGYLPWNTLQPDKVWYEHVLEALAVDYEAASELRKLIRGKPNGIKRIVWQHDETFLVKLIEILTAENQTELPKALEELQEVVSQINSLIYPVTSLKEIQNIIWEQVMKTVADEKEKLTWDRLVEKIIPIYLPDISVIKAVVANSSLKPKMILPVLKKLEKSPELLLKKKSPALLDKNKIKDTDKKTDHKELEGDKSIDEEGLFVRNAGTVLVHAFLPELFKRLQWIREGKFKSRSLQQKAMYLLYYMAIGSIKAEEYELVIPKVLCAWPLKMPVEKDIELITEELNKADNMLQAAIEQWAVLKNTSIDGLREGFLQRNGKLFTKNSHLYLQVESQSIDVLLDQLPWNLSMIKLPWMKEILRVEWR